MRQHGDNANVLIVDNEPQTIRLLLEILARKGIGARLAADRKAALDALDGSGCDLAFLSTPLAGADPADGFKLLERDSNRGPRDARGHDGRASRRDRRRVPAPGRHPDRRPRDPGGLPRFPAQAAGRPGRGQPAGEPAAQSPGGDRRLGPGRQIILSTRSSARAPSSSRPSRWPRGSPPPRCRFSSAARAARARNSSRC